MNYKKFIIKGYRGLSDPTEINLTKESIIPIIGKNESGKTTCLEAIYAFDYSNDTDNGGKHLINVSNLYSTLEPPVIIAAQISIDIIHLDSVFHKYIENAKAEFLLKNPQSGFSALHLSGNEADFTEFAIIKAYQLLYIEVINLKSLVIERDLLTKLYHLQYFDGLIPPDIQDIICRELVKILPYILYFDDFRDRVPEKLYIIESEENRDYSKWIKYFDELFKQTNKDYSVFALATKQDSKAKSIIYEVEKFLNKILMDEWSKYQFDSNNDLQITIEYISTGEQPYFKFKIIENVFIDGELQKRVFDISDRSKGFFWYFNFMIKLNFNPTKRNTDDLDTIYLLDEPGSYLHSYALNKLAEQIKKLSTSNKVIYCTHFHNLLNPHFIPINSIRIAEKANKGKINIKRIGDVSLIRTQRNSAFQPILDALEIKPPIMDYDYDNIVLIEGIYDYYSFTMFATDQFSYFPCVSASSIIHQIPYMIFLHKKYLALWDNDSEGRKQMEKAKEQFGEVESKKFILLNSLSDEKNAKLETYYDEVELSRFRIENSLLDVSFEKIILQLFFSVDRPKLIEEYFPKTKKNFEMMEVELKNRINLIN